MTTGEVAPFWDMVDGVLVINLDRRPERWQHVRNIAAGLIPTEKLARLPAIAGTKLPGYGKRPWFRGRKRDLTWAGRAGCTLSHRAAIAHAKAHGWRTLLILEDDIVPTAALPAVLQALPQALGSQDWDICYLGYTDPVSPYRRLADLPEGHSLCRIYGANTAHAYLLRHTTFDWLLARLPGTDEIWPWLSMHRAIDRWYYRNLSRRFVVTAISPSVIHQRGDFSDITQRAHEKRHLMHVPGCHMGTLGFALLSALRWLGFRLAEPRDWLRGRIKQMRGF